MAVFSYDIQKQGEVTVLNLAGRLTDPFTAKTIFENLKEGISEQEPLLLAANLHSLEYINSTGLQLLLQLLRHSRQLNGEMVIFDVPDRIKKLLAVTKLEHIFKSFENLETAQAELAKTKLH
jgi:anti-anti-sigma factor